VSVRADVPRRTRASEQSEALLFGRNDPPVSCLWLSTPLNGLANMDWADYLRDQAIMYLQLAEQADDPAVQNEMLELASVCEEVANNMEDHLTPG
jgi:hypothetical protein